MTIAPSSSSSSSSSSTPLHQSSRPALGVRYQPLAIDSRSSNVGGRDPNSAGGGGDDDDDNNNNNNKDSSNIDSSYRFNLRQEDHFRLYAAFWCLGLLNNASYVIMLAAAKSISEGGTALVFLANILPALAIKGTAPYWFDAVSYEMRLRIATACMCICFILVASSTSMVAWQLLGVAFASLQGGLGEASLLALAGRVDGAVHAASDFEERTQERTNGGKTNIHSDKGQCLTSFSSGTGAAGVFGFFWKWLFNDWMGLSLSATLWLALASLPISYWGTFVFVAKWKQQHQNEKRQLLPQQDLTEEQPQNSYRDESPDSEAASIVNSQDPLAEKTMQRSKNAIIKNDDSTAMTTLTLDPDLAMIDNNHCYSENSHLHEHEHLPVEAMTGRQRFLLVVTRLWPYMTPLFVVYVAEYALQSGTWTAIGFPSVQNREDRNKFFVLSNWMYQLGVFVSRSSGTIFTAPITLLWLMPILQVINVGFYWHVAATASDDDAVTSDMDSSYHQYGPTVLYAGALYAGLLGGAVYVHCYKRICKDLPLQYREFALSATSVAECLGIVVADVLGLVIQSCLYRIHGLQSEAVITCPVGSQ